MYEVQGLRDGRWYPLYQYPDSLMASGICKLIVGLDDDDPRIVKDELYKFEDFRWQNITPELPKAPTKRAAISYSTPVPAEKPIKSRQRRSRKG